MEEYGYLWQLALILMSTKFLGLLTKRYKIPQGVGALLAGLILGRGLHLYIMKTIEMDKVMFGDAVRPVSYVYSFVLTMIFALFVNLVMYNRLRKVPMVESLKSVE